MSRIEFDEADVLERRPVASGPEGSTEWVRLRSDADDAGTWHPVWHLPNGKMEEPVWLPLPGSQYSFLECPVFEALYEGTRGPGKTLTLLMDYARDVGRGYGKAWRGVLFRKTFGDLDDVVRKIEEWFPLMFGDSFRFLKSKSEYAAVWTTGESLLLRHLRNADDYDDYHGHEYPWIGFEELTQWEDPDVYMLMQSCCRPPRPGVPCRVRASTNPYGVGHNWVKRRFKLPDHRGRVIRVAGEMPRVAVHGALRENFILLHGAPDYEIQIRNAAKNPAQAAAWLQGDWDVTAGGMIDDLWNSAVHVVPFFPVDRVPRGWRITRAYDHGQSRPFSVGWFLESNGEPMSVNGRLIGNVRGDVILWNEWYGTTGQPNEGLTMSSRRIAEGIRDREMDLGVWRRVHPGPADTEIWNRSNDRQRRSPADDMEDVGVTWERADKSSGSRHRGWEMMRTFLTNAYPNPDGTRERPGFFVTDRCRWWLELVPPMPRDEDDPDDVPKKYEDHAADMTRYRLSWDQPVMWRRDF